MANSSISLVSLDVPTLEASLKSFMRAQPLFRDYDFDGSNLAALIRLLSYNTHLNAFYLNMVHSEGWNDSAQTRGSIVSHAKELNYVPRSARSARARLSLSFSGTEPSYVIEKGKTFSAIIKNRGVIFSIPETSILTSSNGTFSFETDVYEGRYVSDSHVVNYSDEAQRFLLSNPSVDSRSLVVVVYEDGQVSGMSYSRATTLLDLDGTSRVYFLQATETGQYEVIFGDSVIGRRPADGATVILDYRVTGGKEGNGARAFSIDFGIGEGSSNVRVSTVSAAEGGDGPESIESIRYYAPRHFQVQERAVTALDYAILLKTQFPEIRAVSSYGGEDAVPPKYGKVIVAVDVTNVDGIPQSKRDEYYDFLKRRAGLTIEPVIVEPEYTFVSIRSEVLYNINLTTISPENVGAIVTDAVLTYADEFLNDFDVVLRYSRLVGLIDDSHLSIVGNQTSVEIYKKVTLDAEVPQTFGIDFGMPLYDGYPQSGTVFPIGDLRTIRSAPYAVASENRYVTDDGDGNLWEAVDRGASTILIKKLGSVDYSTGSLLVSGLLADRLIGGSDLKVYARPAELDFEATRRTILTTESDEIRISVEATRE